jgi:ATP phosphoribosyltransferase regulatory subunit
MKIGDSVLTNDEKAVFRLRDLYGKYGYSQYKMSKFEEYDLYVRNKNFLISDHIITFNDQGGKLMALKPDVTLSIVKNTKDVSGYVNKVYYNENVYRVQKGSDSFKEIMQVGLECVGEIDSYCLSEVLTLALESLKQISDDFVLDVSHLGVLSAVLDNMNVSDEARVDLLHCVGEKNTHGIDAICISEGVSAEACAELKVLVATYGEPEDVIARLKDIIKSENGKRALFELETVLLALGSDAQNGSVRIDFSVINDMSYYNGIVFRGFINGVPTGILSGGQYDLLMKKMGKKAGAIGFAVYPDLLNDRDTGVDYDVDTLIVYDDSADIGALRASVRMLTESGKSVMAQRGVPEKLRYRQLLRFKERGVEILETNA